MKNRVKELRLAAGLTQAELGARMGMTTGNPGVNVGRYEKEDQRLTLPIIIDIANALGVRPLDIVSDTETVFVAAAAMVKVRGQGRSMMFDRAMLERLAGGSAVEAVQIEDDAMEPTLAKGAIAVVNVGSASVSRDGLYLIQIGVMEAVRRINMQLDGSLRVSADNAKRAPEMMARPEDLAVLGRVLWAGGVV